MRRTWVAVLASMLWLACGGDDVTNPFDKPDAAGGRGGSAGSGGGGGARDGASDRSTSTGGGGTGGSGATRDASDASVPDGNAPVPDGNAPDALDAPSTDSTDAGSGGGRPDAAPESGNDGGVEGDVARDGSADAPDVSLGTDAAADVVSEDRSGDEPGCGGPNDCPTPANECLYATCVDGGCGTAPVAQGTAVAAQVPGDCKRKVCNGNGGTQDQNDDSDVQDDAKVCTLDGCSAGSPTHTPRTGQTCGTSGVCSNLGECVGCNVPADCPGTDDFCKTRKCENNMCGFTYKDQGTALPSDQQTAGDCKTKACNGAGGVQDDATPTDVASDGNVCTQDTCNGTTPSHPPEPSGTACGGSHKCDGAGACVECLLPADCGSTGNQCVLATCSNDHHCGTANADPTTNCGAGPSCASGLGHLQDKCNGSGVCVPGASPLCSPFVCGATACNTSCSDNNGCAATFECDTGLTSCIPTGTPKCTDYCSTIMGACTGVNQEYPSLAECLHSCAGLPRTDAVSTNTIACRTTHAGLAVGDPVTHCPHAGPAGDGVCGANCESFCSLAATTCTGANQQFTVGPNCMAACAAYSMTPARYTSPGGAAGGNTFACRMYHLTLATIDPGTHCPHIAVTSATCF
jgi:hypothetical protein